MAYTAEVWTTPITVAETQSFLRQAHDVWRDDEREAFIDFIARNPEAGDIIRDGGGGPQSSVGQARHRQTWGCSGHLFFPRPRHAALFTLGLCEGGTHGPFA